MDENTKCVLVFLIMMVGIVAVFYLAIAQGSTKGQTFRSMTKTFEKANTKEDKLFAGFISFPLLMKRGAWGAFVILVVVAVNGVIAICGQQPYTFWLEVWDRFQTWLTKKPAAPELVAPPA